jgi:hypothetical protein
MMRESFTSSPLLDQCPKMFRPGDHFPYEKVIFQVIPKVTAHDFHYGIRMYFTCLVSCNDSFTACKNKVNLYEKKNFSFVKKCQPGVGLCSSYSCIWPYARGNDAENEQYLL